MKNVRKIVHIIIDIALITLVFALTEEMLRKVFHSESFWLELAIYIVLYAVAFGAKQGIIVLCNRLILKKLQKESE